MRELTALRGVAWQLRNTERAGCKSVEWLGFEEEIRDIDGVDRV